MAADQAVIDAIDQTIAYFNTRKLDLPDGFFDRKTQFVVNGATFESLLSSAPNDPLVLMLARGPAGYRFSVKALQHAVPEAKLERGDVNTAAAHTVVTKVWLSGNLRGTNQPVNVLVDVTLRMTPGGQVEVAEATVDPAVLQSLREARLKG
jgi:hypothetical protein